MKNIVFNELSLQPYAIDLPEFNQRLKDLIAICKIAKDKFNFKKLVFAQTLINIKFSEMERHSKNVYFKRRQIVY